jgi:hypothetical protein
MFLSRKVLAMHSRLNDGPYMRSGNRNGRRHQLVELPQATPLLVAVLRRAARERSGPLPSIDVADALLDERRDLTAHLISVAR